MIGYFVSGAAAVVKDDQGKIRYLYEGAVMPSSVPQVELDRLEKLGLVSQFELLEPVEIDAAVLPRENETVLPLKGGEPPVRPRDLANKATWLDYRVALGHVTDEQRTAIDADQLVLTSAQLKDDAFMDDWATSPASTPAAS